MSKIKSETEFMWKIIFHILILPITFFRALFGRCEWNELLKPLKLFVSFILEAKFTLGIILINVLFYIWSLFWRKEFFDTLVSYPQDILHFKFYTLISSGFLHADLTHLIGNMIAIFVFGRIVERKLGIIKTTYVYFGALVLSGIFSSLIHLFILGNNTGGIGASGAVMGLVATAILIDPFYLTHELIIPMPAMLVGWITIYADIMGVLNPVEDGIGHFAHIGGFLSIAFLAFIFGIEERKKLKKGLVINIASIIVLGGLYFLMMKL